MDGVLDVVFTMGCVRDSNNLKSIKFVDAWRLAATVSGLGSKYQVLSARSKLLIMPSSRCISEMPVNRSSGISENSGFVMACG